MKVNDLESPVILKTADVLGWSGNTGISVVCDEENDRIMIMKQATDCVFCGKGDFLPLLQVNGRTICICCMKELIRAFRRYVRRRHSQKGGKI